jgi:hypothetical protein
MGLRHPHIPALLGHLLATLALGRCHCCTRQYARRNRQGSQHQRQSGNTEFDRQFQHYQSIYNISLSTTDSKTQQARKGFRLPRSEGR